MPYIRLFLIIYITSKYKSMKTFLIGSHSTGKTTLIRKMEQVGFNVKHESIRECLKTNPNLRCNEQGNEESQSIFFEATLASASERTNFVSDRSPIDVLAYTAYLFHNGRVSEEFFNDQFTRTQKFVLENNNANFVLLPVRFPVKKDGVRSEDETYRKEIEKEIKVLLKRLGVKYVELDGTVDERTAKLVEIHCR